MVKGRTEQKIESLFGTVTLLWSTCPLMTYPVSVKFGKNAGIDDKEYTAWIKGLPLDQEYKTRREVK